MHDIGRTQLEGEMEFGEFEFSGELQEVFNEAEQMELAAELLEIRDEQELNYFLGDLIKKGSGVLGKRVKPSLGQSLLGILKGAAKNAAGQAIPVISGAIEEKIPGNLGTAVGKGLTAFGTQLLNPEYEFLNQEDREFEGAKQFVQLAASTLKNATDAPPGADPRAVARSAMIKAAQTIAPGLLQAGTGAAGGAAGVPQAGVHGRSGRWYRRGNKIVLQGA
jgi:hypothetical protein